MKDKKLKKINEARERVKKGEFYTEEQAKKLKEYNEYINKEFEILKGHFERCMLRCLNKGNELNSESKDNEKRN